MCLSSIFAYNRIVLISFLVLTFPTGINASDYQIKGVITDASGGIVPNARISITHGATEYSALSSSDGSYSVRISGIYSDISGVIETGIAFPSPFSYSVNIPVILSGSGDLNLGIYNLSGQKIMELKYTSVNSGSYRLIWDGCYQNGSQVRPGIYIYAVTFKGVTKSGRLVKASGGSIFSSSNSLVPVMMPPEPVSLPASVRIPIVTIVTSKNYYPVRLTDLTIAADTTIDFELTVKQHLPFKTSGNFIARHTGFEYRSLIFKGINLGSSPPGTFPGEIAYAIPAKMYENWINRMGEAGFNSIRIYTLHPPVFYEKLAEYNYRHSDNPLMLFQGIWLEEVEDASDLSSNDLFTRTTSFGKEIHDVIDCINGNGNIAFRPGKAYGKYMSDVSQWTAGYIIGRELSPAEVTITNENHINLTSYTGSQFSIADATATEVFATRFLDEVVYYESKNYNVVRPVSISNWPTLDPLDHPTELSGDEDKESFDVTKISGRKEQAGLFASYHAYPYFPNFISNEPSYREYYDSEGPDSYLGYLYDLKSFYYDIPLIIAEFGVPSSWGSAHQSFSKMNHGGYSEQEQGEKNIRLLKNIINSGCGGGFMFGWIDEWFKPTWIVLYLEAFGTLSDNVMIPTRQLWHNLVSPEQNFGLISFDEEVANDFVTLSTDNQNGPIRKIESYHDNSYFYVSIESSGTFSAGDTIMVAFDTYLKDTGESRLPNGMILSNRSEFLLSFVLGEGNAFHHITQSYDMKGLTPRFDLSDHLVQSFKSTVTNGAPWRLMQWINDGDEVTTDDIGILPMKKSNSFTDGKREAVVWSSGKIMIRMPWTLLYFHDPTQMKVIDGAESEDGGYNYTVFTRESQGIAVSVYNKGVITSVTERYSWPSWLVVPRTKQREKASLNIIQTGLQSLPGFAQ